MKPARVLVPVPADVALAYDGRRWHLLPAPPAWWFPEQEAMHLEGMRYVHAPDARPEFPDLLISGHSEPADRAASCPDQGRC